jgi:hypothetical protein
MISKTFTGTGAGQTITKHFEVTILPMAKSQCMIGDTSKVPKQMPSGFKWGGQAAWTIPTSTSKSVEV